MLINFNLSNLESIIEKNSTPQSRERGKGYHTQGCVHQIIIRDNLLQAKVEGSQEEDYLVNIEFSSKDIKSANCDCFYDQEGWCKHILATLYYYQSSPQNVQEHPTLDQLLARLNPLQMQRLIIKLVNHNPSLIEDIEDQVNIIAPVVNKAKNSTPPTVDTKPIRNQVHRIIKDGIREMEEGWEEFENPIEDELLELIDSTKDLIKNGEVRNALSILGAITETCSENWDDAEEYGIENDYIVKSLNKVFAEAILSVDLDEAEKTALQANLEYWQDEWSVDFGMSLAALAQGWNIPPLPQILTGEITQLSAQNIEEQPAYNDKLTLIRLKVLEAQKRYQEYLYLAKVQGKIELYLTCLVRLGRFDDAIEQAKELITTMEEAFALAKILAEEGDKENALAIACQGLTKEGNCQAELAQWTVELAEELEDLDIALIAQIKAFQAQPTLNDYQKIEQLSGEDWLTLKEDLLRDLQDDQNFYGSNKEKVKILLQESLIDEVIAMVDKSSYLLSYEVLEGVIPFNPDWVIKKAIPKAEEIMDAGKAQYYDTATDWLKKARKAYYQANKAEEWRTYYNHLMTTHARKRKLINLLKPLI